MVRKFRLRLLVRLGQRDPCLKPVQAPACDAVLCRRALRVHNALARGHPVDIAGFDALNGAEAVAVDDRAFE